jgi:hypothetical protein
LEKIFNEAPTREAISAFSARLHSMQNQLTNIHRRTEILSPSKNKTTANPPAFDHHNLLGSPRRLLFPCEVANSAAVTPLLPPPSLLLPAPNISTQTSPVIPETALPLNDPITNISTQTSPVIPETALPSSNESNPGPRNVLTPIIVTITEPITRSFTVLSLTAQRSPHDLILPPRTAFSSYNYPCFTFKTCTWQFIFENVSEPSALWISYAPESLGNYLDIKSLWQAWDEGTYVLKIGRKPALRLIDGRWGNIKNQNNHGRLPSWRPRNDEKVFYFYNSICIQNLNEFHRLENCGLIFTFSSSGSRRLFTAGRALMRQLQHLIICEKVKLSANSIAVYKKIKSGHGLLISKHENIYILI